MENSKTRKLTTLLVCSIILFLILRVGLGYTFGWFNNGSCSTYLGCVNGFFGFDILVHFSSGIFIIIFLLWLMDRFPRLNILHDEFWKNVIILAAIAVFIGISWEMWEFVLDHYRMLILHQDLLHPMNLLMQASNDDTMGDLTFGFLGAISAIFSLRKFMPEVFKKEKTA